MSLASAGPRVLLGKVGLDLHDVGAKFVARSLREAGMEVIYLGPFQTAETMLGAALTEDPDVVAVSTISGEYMAYVPPLVDGLRREGLDPVVLLGGLIAPDDHAPLRAAGVDGIFGSDSQIDDIVRFIHRTLAERRVSSSTSS